MGKSKRILKIISIFLILMGTCGCGQNHTEGTIDHIKYQETEEKTNYIKIEMKTQDIMIAELYPEIAPITVENFQKLVSEKFYDNLTFHRIVKNFMIQGGDPTATGTGGSKETIKGEFSANGFQNELSHERGVLSMARNNDVNSASSQFFICQVDVPSLDGSYAAFGKLIAGFDTLDKLANTKVKQDGETPVAKPIIKSIRFVTVEQQDEFDKK